MESFASLKFLDGRHLSLFTIQTPQATVLSLGSLEPVPEPLEKTAQGAGSGQPLVLLPRVSEKLLGLLIQVFLPISQTALELGFVRGLFTPRQHGEQLSRGEAKHMVKLMGELEVTPQTQRRSRP